MVYYRHFTQGIDGTYDSELLLASCAQLEVADGRLRIRQSRPLPISFGTTRQSGVLILVRIVGPGTALILEFLLLGSLELLLLLLRQLALFIGS